MSQNPPRHMFLSPEEEIFVSSNIDPVEQVMTIAEMRDITAADKRAVVFQSMDSYGRRVSFTLKEKPVEHNVYVVRALSGSAFPASEHNTLIWQDMLTKKVSISTVKELAELDYKVSRPTVLATKKRTKLEDALFFLDGLENEQGKYYIQVDEDSPDGILSRMKQLSHAGVTTRPHANLPRIYIGETQPICWFLKLGINGLCEDKSDYDVIMEDLLTRNIVVPHGLWTDRVHSDTYKTGAIYEGNYIKNRLPILPPSLIPNQKMGFIEVVVHTPVFRDLQTTWYCA